MADEHLLSISEEQYYQQQSDSGNYQFTSLENIINQFMIAYVGEEKIIGKAKRADVAFHAQRAIQELSFDTFKSVKSQELTVPANLSLMLPQDYVNYTNISWTDGAGIQHTIYPTNKVSNPRRRGNLITNPHLHIDDSDWTLGTGWSHVNTQQTGGGLLAESVAVGQELSIPVRVVQGQSYKLRYYIVDPDVDLPGVNDTVTQTAGNLKVSLYGDEGYVNVHTENNNPHSGAGLKTSNLYLHRNHANFVTTTETTTNTLVFEPYDAAFTGLIDRISLVEITNSGQNIEVLSTGWQNYKSHTPNNNIDKYDDGTYDLMLGERYGIDPQHAQANGSFFIEPSTNKLHFSSNLSGKTIILKYISDGLARNNETIVHKFAEEAMYKWIAHAILSTRINTPEYLVARFKKERFAAIRKAKLRLSNIKLEEITQVLRGKSKQIKH